MVLAVVVSIHCLGWKLNRPLGLVMAILQLGTRRANAVICPACEDVDGLKMPEVGGGESVSVLVVVAAPASHLSNLPSCTKAMFPKVFGVLASASEAVLPPLHTLCSMFETRAKSAIQHLFVALCPSLFLRIPQVPRRSCFSGNRATGVAQILSFLSARSSTSGRSQEAALDWNIQSQSEGMAEYSNA